MFFILGAFNKTKEKQNMSERTHIRHSEILYSVDLFKILVKDDVLQIDIAATVNWEITTA